MQFQGSIITEQGITFAIISVKQHIVNNKSESEKIILAFTPIFPNIPIILMAFDSIGRATYFGRKDIVNFLVGVPIQNIPWKEYTVNI